MENCDIRTSIARLLIRIRIQVVLGAKEVAEHLIQSPQISKVSFTGSVATGQKVYQMASRGMKRVTMELGGKSPMIIFDDANIDNAVSAAMMGNWYSSGQVCSNASRVFVQEAIMEDFVEKLVDRTKKLRIGDPMSAETDIGGYIIVQSILLSTILFRLFTKNLSSVNLFSRADGIQTTHGKSVTIH